jgi:hypothetical protein
MTLVARSPCAKIVVADRYSIRRTGTPVQSTSSTGATLAGLVGFLVRLAALEAAFFAG